MAEALNDQLGPQPDFQRMGMHLHGFVSEVDKLQNIPQFDTGRAILEAIKNLDTKVDGAIKNLDTKIDEVIKNLDTKINGLRTELNTKITELSTKVVGIDMKIDKLQERMQIKYVSFNYLSLSILTSPVTKTLGPVFKTPIFATPTMS